MTFLGSSVLGGLVAGDLGDLGDNGDLGDVGDVGVFGCVWEADSSFLNTASSSGFDRSLSLRIMTEIKSHKTM